MHKLEVSTPIVRYLNASIDTSEFGLNRVKMSWLFRRYHLKALQIGRLKDSNWRRERDSNPRQGVNPEHAFQACDFNHSSTSPAFYGWLAFYVIAAVEGQDSVAFQPWPGSALMALG